jgi:hypothetical protein
LPFVPFVPLVCAAIKGRTAFDVFLDRGACAEDGAHLLLRCQRQLVVDVF